MTATVIGSWYPDGLGAAGLLVEILDRKAPCIECGRETSVRTDGRDGHYGCIFRAGRPTAPTAAETSPAAAEETPAAEEIAWDELRLLRDLEHDHAPRIKDERGQLRRPWWRPTLPEPLELVVPVASWSWSRRYQGPTVTLDRCAAWPTAVSSVELVHGGYRELDRPGEYAGLPGLYEVPVYPWTETGMPDPCPAHRRGAETVWVTGARMTLLRDLARQGRRPDCSYVRAWVGDMCRLRSWAAHVAELRTRVIREHGRDDDGPYGAFKVRFSQAVSLMIGKRQPGERRRWPNSPVHRTDWGYTLQEQAAVNLWRGADKIRAAAPQKYGPIRMSNIDEIEIPAEALEYAVQAGAITIDESGLQLGAYSVKARSDG